ncbi:MAG: nucleotidyltransferase domain-containing protein [Cyanobacteria bacterium]|nr:nucleotidyltransferase domain-containing protein [Cyanobacteriota bacterium]
MRRWPAADEVLEQAAAWATLQRSGHPELLAVGVFGSYGRGTAAFGSDLDLLLILRHCDEPIWNRLRRWDTGSLPLACDLLVYSLEEWRSLPQWNPKLAEALLNDTRWLGEMPAAMALPELCRFQGDDHVDIQEGPHQMPSRSRN